MVYKSQNYILNDLLNIYRPYKMMLFIYIIYSYLCWWMNCDAHRRCGDMIWWNVTDSIPGKDGFRVWDIQRLPSKLVSRKSWLQSGRLNGVAWNGPKRSNYVHIYAALGAKQRDAHSLCYNGIPASVRNA